MIRDASEAMMECLEHALYADFGVVEDGDKNLLAGGFTLKKPVRYYGYKDLSLMAERSEIIRPCMIVVTQELPDGDVPRMAGSDYPFIARCGVVVYLEAPLAFKDGDSEYGGRDELLNPMSDALSTWVKAHPSILVPDAVRYEDGDPDNPVVFKHDAIDVRMHSPYRVRARRNQYERISYYLVLETLEVT